jgi:hypothetical protein
MLFDKGVTMKNCSSLGLIVLLMTMLFLSGNTAAQTTECGTVIPPEQAELELRRSLSRALALAPQSEDRYAIPLAIHIVRRNDGVGGLTLAELQAAIDTSSTYAAQTNVSFYQYGAVDYIDDDSYFYGMGDEAKFSELLGVNSVSEAVNVYFVPPTDTSGFPYCGLSTYSSSEVQGIIMNNLCVLPSYSRTTLFHEVGHYFDLYHTHETYFGRECPSGSNCNTAGDLHCDTEADPNLYGHVGPQPECLYDGYEAPPVECDETPYNPPVRNIMSYSRKLCCTEMTAEQNSKFRWVLANVRTELTYGVNGFRLWPSPLLDMAVPQGTSRDTTLRLTYVDSDTVTVSSVTSSTGTFLVSASVPAEIDRTDTLSLVATFDATTSVDSCELGTYRDTIVITFSEPGISPLRVPLSANITLQPVTYTELVVSPGCLPLIAPVTPGISNSSANSLMVHGKGILYDGSLVIAMLDGVDTTAYMDLYQRNDFAALKDYTSGVDALGRTTEKTSFVTNDGRIHGDVTYTYGSNSIFPYGCSYIIVDYAIRNPCDTALTFVSGALGDFNVSDYSEMDRAWVIAEDSLVVAEDITGTRFGAMVLLSSCSPEQRFRAIDNSEVIYPTNGLLAGTAYSLLTESVTGPGFEGKDVSALLSFGRTTLNPGKEVVFRFGLIGSTPETGTRQQILASMRAIGASVDGCYRCGDANSDKVVDISDVVFLIAYIFAGGRAPTPLLSGDANCDKAVDISDVVYLIAYIFSGGKAPCAGC